jgi:RNA polymerase sigma-70 factor, ECF subfamily
MHASAVLEEIYRKDSRRVFATLVRLLGDFDLAEEALAEAFRAAVEQWPEEGVPENPRAWLVSAGRFKAIDAVRRQQRFSYVDEETLDAFPAEPEAEREGIEDDRLRLIFTCCHPALAPEAQVALTLREVCGLTTEEIARAYLSPAPTLAQRIVRAKSKIRDAKIPYEVPGKAELPERLDAVLRVIYLVFNEGYSASSGASVTRGDLSQEAIRVGRLLVDLLPEAEAMGLLALMLIQESRRAARSTPDGEIVLLEDQDRSLWDRALIAEGVELTTRALKTRMFGPYCLQAAIAAVHAEAPSTQETGEGPPEGRPRFAAGDIGAEVWMVVEQARSVQPAQHRHHHQVAGAERPVEPVGTPEPAGEVAEPVTDAIVEDAQALLVPALVALHVPGQLALDDRRLHRVERGEHPCDRARPGPRIVRQQARGARRHAARSRRTRTGRDRRLHRSGSARTDEAPRCAGSFISLNETDGRRKARPLPRAPSERACRGPVPCRDRASVRRP